MIKNVKSRTILIAMLLSLPIISHAKSMICPFKDNFNVSAPALVKILEALPQGNLHYSQRTQGYFELSCKQSSTEAGDLFIKIGYDNDNQCSLIIHDGPFELNPSVTNVYCNGSKINYTGMGHVRGTYDYTLKFM